MLPESRNCFILCICLINIFWLIKRNKCTLLSLRDPEVDPDQRWSTWNEFFLLSKAVESTYLSQRQAHCSPHSGPHFGSILTSFTPFQECESLLRMILKDMGPGHWASEPLKAQISLESSLDKFSFCFSVLSDHNRQINGGKKTYFIVLLPTSEVQHSLFTAG